MMNRCQILNNICCKLTTISSLCFMLILLPARGMAQDDAAKAATSPSRSDEAIKQALEYLKRTQKPDGGWDAGFGRATSVTSLAVMAFLASGHVPGEDGPYRDAVERGVRYVLAHQKPNGMLVSNTSHGPMYCHGISTLMLAEVVGMTRDPALAEEVKRALAKAVELIVKAQDASGKTSDPRHNGGWRYQPTSGDSDLSVTGWQVMALRAAKSAGCAVEAEPIDRAVAYVKKCATKGGGFAYQAGGNRGAGGGGLPGQAPAEVGRTLLLL